MKCPKCGDKIRRLSRNRWGCLNCRWHGPSRRRPTTVIDLFELMVRRRADALLKQIVGGK